MYIFRLNFSTERRGRGQIKDASKNIRINCFYGCRPHVCGSLTWALLVSAYNTTNIVAQTRTRHFLSIFKRNVAKF